MDEQLDIKPNELRKLDQTPTAAVLGMFRRELISEGFSTYVADHLVRAYATGEMGSKLILSRSTPDDRCSLCGLPKDTCKTAQQEEFLRG